MIKEYFIDLALEPVSCPRPRISKWGVYYPSIYKQFQKQTKEELLKYKDALESNDAPMHIVFTFVFKRPKYMYNKKYSSSRIIHTKKPDLDNLVKAVNDALQSSGIIKDDSQIYAFTAMKYYAAIDESESIQITIQKG